MIPYIWNSWKCRLICNDRKIGGYLEVEEKTDYKRNMWEHLGVLETFCKLIVVVEKHWSEVIEPLDSHNVFYVNCTTIKWLKKDYLL